MTVHSAVLLVGLTGNYGMGKSSVLGLFREMGAVTISADEIVSDLLSEKDIIGRVTDLLGDEVIINGSLDKRRISGIVFRNSTLRRGLEDILHPRVLERIDSNVSDVRSRSPKGAIIVVEVPLLFEGGYAGRYDRTITVSTQENVVLRRLARTGLSTEDILLRLGAQMPVEEKERHSDYVIHNSGDFTLTRTQVEKIFSMLENELRVRNENRQGI